MANIGLLAVFKYYNFFVENVNILLACLHLSATPIPAWSLILPLGISFHTFQAMSYTLEVYKGRQKAERHPGIYALYVMFYPQLVAGPIERPAQLIPQFYDRHDPDYAGIASGLKTMLFGFFMKVVVADRLAIYVNYVYQDPAAHSRLALLTAIVFFTFQIYCDFAGYSLIAIGAARTMGFTLAGNFRRPYLATSIAGFWRRWHITLSTWFRDYLYIPMGGNRRGRSRYIVNIAVVFLLSGLWHGAAWTFIIWGGLHGGAVIIGSLVGRPQKTSGWYTAAAWLMTFGFLCFSWVFFRAADPAQALTILHRLIDPHTPWQLPGEFRQRSLLLCCFLGITTIAIADTKAEFFPDEHGLFHHRRTAIRLTACTALIVIILLFGVFNASQFIYFQF
jgi:D-alanyl-lipoteichoic acid acyltransferase DltB (MBOAT superfamily)